MSDNSRAPVELPGLDGSVASTTADVTRYFTMPRAGFLKELRTMVETAADFTTGDEQARVLVTYTTDGSAFVTVHTESLANANLWSALVARDHPVSTAASPIRIPAGAVVRVVFDVNGTTPIFPNLHVVLGLQFV